MMFLLSNIGAPPTIGSLAAMARPATAKAITALALSNLIFIVGTPFSVRPRASAALSVRRTPALRAELPIGCGVMHPFARRLGNLLRIDLNATSRIILGSHDG